jgi:hypothetical protein
MLWCLPLDPVCQWTRPRVCHRRSGRGLRSQQPLPKIRRSPLWAAEANLPPDPESSREQFATCLGVRGRQVLAETLADVPEDDDDLSAEEQENLEETLVDDATAAQTVAELESEIRILEGLEQQAKAVVASGQDRKWDELSKILQNNPEMHDAAGRQRKIIIFSEHRDTLNYLHGKIAGVLGNSDAIITIHGGTHLDKHPLR